MKREARKWTIEWDPKIEERFNDLIENEEFQRLVSGFRNTVKTKPEREQLKILDETTDSIIERFDLRGKTFYVPVREYLCSGKIFISPYSGLHSELVFGKGNVSVIIYPGATEREIKKMLHDWWIWIKPKLKMVKPTARHFRKRIKRDRDTAIFELYKSKVIRFDGSINQVVAKDVLRKKDGTFVSRLVTRDDILRILNVDLPKSEATKKIVLRFKKKNKV
jgi:hypothetical protein